MVLRSTYHKPIFSAREWDGRASCEDGEKIARPRPTGDRSVEISCVAPQCNRRITAICRMALMGRQLATRLPVVREQIVATSIPRWGHPKLRPTCQNDVQVMLRSATRCTQLGEIGWGEAVVDTKHCVQK